MARIEGHVAPAPHWVDVLDELEFAVAPVPPTGESVMLFLGRAARTHWKVSRARWDWLMQKRRSAPKHRMRHRRQRGELA